MPFSALIGSLLICSRVASSRCKPVRVEFPVAITASVIRLSCRLCACLLMTALLSGCFSGAPAAKFTRNAVQGTILLDGKPLTGGMISFEPDQGSPTATAGGAAVKDGKFALPKESGLAAGKYRVFITSLASEGTTTKSADDLMNNPPPPAKELLPAKYNTRSTLTAVITDDKNIPLNFELTSSQ